MDNEDWSEITQILSDCAQKLEKSGAEIILLCSNTVHRVYQSVQASVKCPVLHIGEALTQALLNQRISKVVFFGTRLTMQEDFIHSILTRSGITVVLPNVDEQEAIHQIIFTELALGIVRTESQEFLLKTYHRLRSENKVEGIVLGCTELSLIIKPENIQEKIIDTLHAHVQAALGCMKA